MPTNASRITRFRVVSVLGITLLTIAASMALAGGRAAESHVAPKETSPLPQTEPPLEASVKPQSPPRNEYLGVILARFSAEVAPRFQGRVLDVLVRLGDSVKTGDVIAILDVPSLRHDLRIAEASMGTVTVDQSRALVELSEAEEKLARRKTLAAEALATGEDLSAARYQQQLAAARVESARAQLGERRANVERLRQDNADAVIRSPFDGVVASRYVDPGSTVSPLTPIVRMISARDVFLRFALPDHRLSAISVGQTITAFVGDRRIAITCTIDKIAPEVDAASRMIFVEARLPLIDPQIPALAGEMARVSIDQPFMP